MMEHTETLAHLLRDAKHAQREITVVLLDLRNAFGSVHHNLIRSALPYHLPDIFLQLFNSIYSNSHVSVAINKDWTSLIKRLTEGFFKEILAPLSYSISVSTR